MPAVSRTHIFIGLTIVLIASWLIGMHGDAVARILGVLAGKVTRDKIEGVAVNAFLLLPLAILIELPAVGWRHSSLRRLFFRTTVSSRIDLLMFVMTELRLPRALMKMLSLTVFNSAATLGSGALSIPLGLERHAAVNSPILGFLVCAGIQSFMYYWIHRAQHLPVFWPLHRLHHSAQDMSIITSYRDNIFAGLVIDLIAAIPLSLVSLPASSILAYQYASHVQDSLIHSSWLSSWGVIGRVITSPLYHRLHHSIAPQDLNRNFSNVFPLWDRLFGTYKAPDGNPITIGVDHPAYDGVGSAMRMMVFEVGESVTLAIRLFRRPWSAPAGMIHGPVGEMDPDGS